MIKTSHNIVMEYDQLVSKSGSTFNGFVMQHPVLTFMAVIEHQKQGKMAHVAY